MRIGHECPVYQVKTDFDEGCKDPVSTGVKEVSAVSLVGFKETSASKTVKLVQYFCNAIYLNYNPYEKYKYTKYVTKKRLLSPTPPWY